MTGVFKPRIEILPPAQQRLWQELRPSAELGFALYGGTAIDDGDLKTLTKAVRSLLVHAVSAVRDLPHVEVLSRRIVVDA